MIPFRGTGKKLEICLIRRKGSKKWGIPKGFVERGDTSKDAALKEAFEEAGLKGRLVGDAVGNYEYQKMGDDAGRHRLSNGSARGRGRLG